MHPSITKRNYSVVEEREKGQQHMAADIDNREGPKDVISRAEAACGW